MVLADGEGSLDQEEDTIQEVHRMAFPGIQENRRARQEDHLGHLETRPVGQTADLEMAGMRHMESMEGAVGSFEVAAAAGSVVQVCSVTEDVQPV